MSVDKTKGIGRPCCAIEFQQKLEFQFRDPRHYRGWRYLPTYLYLNGGTENIDVYKKFIIVDKPNSNNNAVANLVMYTVYKCTYVYLSVYISLIILLFHVFHWVQLVSKELTAGSIDWNGPSNYSCYIYFGTSKDT